MYAEVIILSKRSSNIDKGFFYAVPNEFVNKIKIGMLVNVSFGLAKKLDKAIVINFKKKVDLDPTKIKLIEKIEPQILVDKKNIELAVWMQKKYYCDLASCLKLMLPDQKNVRDENLEFDFYYSQVDWFNKEKKLTK